VQDDIELSRFVDHRGTAGAGPLFSPDGKRFVVQLRRGVIQSNLVEERLYIYSADEVLSWVTDRARLLAPSPRILNYSAPEAPVITHVRWSDDSRFVIFIAKEQNSDRQLVEYDVSGDRTRELSEKSADVTGFDASNGHLAYLVFGAKVRRVPDGAPPLVATGKSLYGILFPEDRYPEYASQPCCEVWRIRGNGATAVRERVNGPVYVAEPPEDPLWSALAVSPDGKFIVAFASAENEPTRSDSAVHPPDAFVLVDLETGQRDVLALRPRDLGTAVLAPNVAWTADSRAVILTGTEAPDSAGQSGTPSPRCILLVNVRTRSEACLLRVSGDGAELSRRGIGAVWQATVDRHDAKHLSVIGSPILDGLPVYERSERYSILVNQRADVIRVEPIKASHGQGPLAVQVREDLNHPPVLIGRSQLSGNEKVLLDPNPQLASVALGMASTYRWHDTKHETWVGGLVKPPDWLPSMRYPLVIQTHGYDSEHFLTFGSLPTAMAARALAGQGIVVLQVAGSQETVPTTATEREGPLEVEGYSSAITQLVSDGIVDSRHVGIIGFSRTVFGVLSLLVDSRTPIVAAKVSDGIDASYWQYMLSVDTADDEAAREFNSMIGAAPFGPGFDTWLHRSPAFKSDRIRAPVQLEALGPWSLLSFVGSYAPLRYLRKPVDLVFLTSNEHVLSNPRMRMASQGGTVDWMRFWLQDYEDPAPEKVEQYRRWRELRQMQKAQNRDSVTAPTP
jgi:dipeptidyl aminopeptidase/acylaminoacyl peptidase